ncbi:MAG TPA: class I SAM-dependent methyltransferase [Dehalococcoidales bacterium]|nr:class I SAM-dependent methyltransferase [Dehalococcoidales bacterium]
MMKSLRRSRDLGIGGAMARWYDKNTRQHRLEEMKGYAKEVASHVKDGASILEVAPGPGYLSIELAKTGKYRVTGMDISRDFVEIARKNAREAGAKVEFVQGNVSEMPFLESTFDFIVCSAAFKNFKEPLKALEEMYRVLKAGGAVLILDMNREVSNNALAKATAEMGVKGLEALFMNFSFKYFLKRGAYTKNEFNDLISRTNFKAHDVKEYGIGLYVYMQK